MFWEGHENSPSKLAQMGWMRTHSIPPTQLSSFETPIPNPFVGPVFHYDQSIISVSSPGRMQLSLVQQNQESSFFFAAFYAFI